MEGLGPTRGGRDSTGNGALSLTAVGHSPAYCGRLALGAENGGGKEIGQSRTEGTAIGQNRVKDRPRG